MYKSNETKESRGIDIPQSRSPVKQNRRIEMKLKVPLRFAFGFEGQTGKDTAIEYLINNYGGVMINISEDLYDIQTYTQKKCGLKVEKDREFLQFVGQWARRKNPKCWINKVKEKIEKIDRNMCIYVNGIRDKGDFTELKSMGYIMIRIKRDVEKRALTFGNGDIRHETEVALIDADWNYTIDNNTTREQLYDQLNKIVQDIVITTSID